MSVIVPNYLDAIVENYPNIVVKSLGAPSDYANLVHEAGPSLPTKAELDLAILTMTRNLVWLKIQEERTRRQAGGVFIQSANKWFHSDQASRIQQLGLVMMGVNMPPNINWKAMDGSFVIMTPALAMSIFNAAATLDMTAFGVAEQHRLYVMSSNTPSTYDYSSFWPAIYGA